VALAQGLRINRTLRQLNLAGVKGLDDAGACALAGAVASSKVMTALNLAFVKLSAAAVDALVQVRGRERACAAAWRLSCGEGDLRLCRSCRACRATPAPPLLLLLLLLYDDIARHTRAAQAVNASSSLRVVAVSQAELPVEGARKLVGAVSALAGPKAPPSLSCNLTLGAFPVEGLDNKVQFLVVSDQEALLADAWQGLAGAGAGEGEGEGGAAHASGAGAAEGAAALPAAAAAEGASALATGGGNSSDGEDAPLLASTAGSTRAPPQQQQQQQQHGEISSSSGSGQQQQSAASTFDVLSSPSVGLLPAAAGAGAGGLLPQATAAWFSGGSSSHSSGHLATVASFTQARDAPAAHLPAASPAASSSSSRGGAGGASSSKAAAAGGGGGPSPGLGCPCLVLVVVQDSCVSCMTQAPLLFEELDTLDLAGLGIGDEGAASMASTLRQNPALRRCNLADNAIGEDGAAALSAALAVNTALQVRAGSMAVCVGGFAVFAAVQACRRVVRRRRTAAVQCLVRSLLPTRVRVSCAVLHRCWTSAATSSARRAWRSWRARRATWRACASCGCWATRSPLGWTRCAPSWRCGV
jgi:hypothetical protein